jgi:hypothetical protein
MEKVKRAKLLECSTAGCLFRLTKDFAACDAVKDRPMCVTIVPEGKIGRSHYITLHKNSLHNGKESMLGGIIRFVKMTVTTE